MSLQSWYDKTVRSGLAQYYWAGPSDSSSSVTLVPSDFVTRIDTIGLTAGGSGFTVPNSWAWWARLVCQIIVDDIPTGHPDPFTIAYGLRSGMVFDDIQDNDFPFAIVGSSDPWRTLFTFSSQVFGIGNFIGISPFQGSDGGLSGSKFTVSDVGLSVVAMDLGIPNLGAE